MNWLITGGAGFIGCNLVARLRAEGGHTIRVLDNLSGGTREDLKRVTDYREVPAEAVTPMHGDAGGDGDVELVVGDILDEALAPRAAEGATVIVHLAANTGVAPSVADPRADCLANVMGTLNMLESARHAGARRFVLASSGAPLGVVDPPLHEGLAPRPASPYGASKLAGEGYCSAYFHSFGVETVALRFGNVYGPRSSRKNSVVARFISRALSGRPLEIYGDGNQTRDFLYVDDLVGAVSAAASAPGIGGEVFQIATSRETAVSELVVKLSAALAAAGVPEVPAHKAPARVGDVQRNFSDTRKARKKLGWSAATGLEEGLASTVAWFVAERSA